jgi:SAM-dependent methyltransferase
MRRFLHIESTFRHADEVTQHSSAAWDAEAPAFDDQPDHGLRDPAARRAWQRFLRPLFDEPSSQVVADLGCGTGTLTVLLADSGLQVDGVDHSHQMLDLARAKAQHLQPPPTFIEADVADPPLRPGTYDTVLTRHVLWAMADPAAALRNWIRLLKPRGQLILIEGRWSTGAGLGSDECSELVLRHRDEAVVQRLTDPELWGGPITDERYLLRSLC